MNHGGRITGDLVVLGDCASNGSNTMLHEVFDDPELTATFSMNYHLINRRHIMAWYLRNRKSGDNRTLRLDQIERLANEHQAQELGVLGGDGAREATQEFNREFTMDSRFQGHRLMDWYLSCTGQSRGDFADTEQLRMAALGHLKQLEEQRAWVRMLKNPLGGVHNYSVNGNHFGNYVLRIKKHVAQHGKPRLVLITDYEQDHIFTNLWHDGQRHTALMSPRYLYMEPEDQAKVSSEVYNLRRRQYIYQRNKPRQYRDRKSRRYQALLEKYLKQERIPYLYILYMHENLPFVSDRDFIDLRAIYDSWFIDKNGERYRDGHSCKKKFDTQPVCARIVQERIEGLI
jgi:hypothetical protein